MAGHYSALFGNKIIIVRKAQISYKYIGLLKPKHI